MTSKLRELLELDYRTTQSFIDKADDILFRIKNWAITTNGGIFALAISTKNKNVLVVNLVLIACFWLLELFYKCFHEDAMEQNKKIEEYLFEDTEDSEIRKKKYVFGLGHTIKLPRVKKMIEIIFKRLHITFLYLVMLLVTILTFGFFENLF